MTSLRYSRITTGTDVGCGHEGGRDTSAHCVSTHHAAAHHAAAPRHHTTRGCPRARPTDTRGGARGDATLRHNTPRGGPPCGGACQHTTRLPTRSLDRREGERDTASAHHAAAHHAEGRVSTPRGGIASAHRTRLPQRSPHGHEGGRDTASAHTTRRPKHSPHAPTTSS